MTRGNFRTALASATTWAELLAAGRHIHDFPLSEREVPYTDLTTAIHIMWRRNGQRSRLRLNTSAEQRMRKAGK